MEQHVIGLWCARRDVSVPGDVARLLASVPEWFGREEAIAAYVVDARGLETWTVRDATGAVVGVTLVARHFPHVAEVYLMVVERAYHGHGVGSTMLKAIERDARDGGVRLLEAKTLGPSHPDPGYARTRRFYEKMGFLALAETDLWGEGTPLPDHGQAARRVSGRLGEPENVPRQAFWWAGCEGSLFTTILRCSD